MIDDITADHIYMIIMDQLNNNSLTTIDQTDAHDLARHTLNHNLAQLPDDFLDTTTREQIRKLSQRPAAARTIDSYISDLEYFRAWLKADAGLVFVPLLTRLQPGEIGLPLPLVVVQKFVSTHLDGLDPAVDALLCRGIKIGNRIYRAKAKPGPHKVATVERRLAALSVLHEVKGITKDANPCVDPSVRVMLKIKRRTNAADGIGQERKEAITADMLWQMLDAADEGLTGIRDRALLLFIFRSGGRRRSEATDAKVNQLVRVPRGYLFRRAKAKTDQAGEGKAFPLYDDAAQALDAWLAASGITTGPLFRSVNRHGQVGAKLRPASVNEIVKKLVGRIGLDPSPYGAHSLRSGYCTQAGIDEINLIEAMDMSDHRDMATFRKYYRTGKMLNSRAANVGARPPEILDEP